MRKIRSNDGSKKANVFPLPVRDRPNTSLVPVTLASQVLSWISVMVSIFIAFNASLMLGCKLDNSLNFLDDDDCVDDDRTGDEILAIDEVVSVFVNSSSMVGSTSDASSSSISFSTTEDTSGAIVEK